MTYYKMSTVTNAHQTFPFTLPAVHNDTEQEKAAILKIEALVHNSQYPVNLMVLNHV